MWTLSVAFVAVVLVLWGIWRKISFSELRKLGIPGPEPNMIFGNMLEMVTKTPLVAHTEWINKYGKVVGYYFGNKPLVLIADIDLLKKIQVSDFHKFMNRPNVARRNAPESRRVEGFSESLITLRDKRWKEVRSILTPSFTASKMRQMAPIMNGAINSLLKNVEKKSLEGKAFDIYEMYQGLTMDVIGRTAFGIQTDVQNDPNDPFLRTAKVLFSGDIRSPLAMLALSFRELERLWFYISRLNLRMKNKGSNPVSELIESVKGVIALRRKDKSSRRPDLMQLMMDAQISESDIASLTADDLTAKDEDKVTAKPSGPPSGKLMKKMSDDNVLDNAVLVFLAGYETTSTALAFTTHLLLHHPDVQDKARKEVQELLKTKGELDYSSVNELQYLDQVLNESLRFYPPIYMFVSREAGEDVDFGSFKLTKGMGVQVPIYYLHRNPELWEDPDRFDPDRFSPENKKKHHPMAFQPFGGGPRNCLGMRFALMEAKLALARLLAKYKLVKCPETDKEPINLKISAATMNPAKGVYLRAVPC